jgi:hypothetical protein
LANIGRLGEGTTSRGRQRLYGVLAIAVIVLGASSLLQSFGYNQGAHYSLVKALHAGTAQLDDFQAYSGDESYFRGHYFSNKAPGLAFLCLPLYTVLQAVGLPSGVHVLALLGAVLPALILFLLVRRVGEDWAPGYGTAAAVTLAMGSLFLPFTSLFFSHVLSAFLGFAAFFLLWRERAGPSRLALVAAAGLVAGLAVTSEYPLALVGFAVGCYAITRTPIVRRGLAYAAGVLAGVMPLLLYNKWAFGSFTHLSYSNLVVVRGRSGHDVIEGQTAGFHDVTAPRARVLFEVLFAPRGLLRLMPVFALGVVGIVLLYRRGRRAEALLIAGVCLLILGYDTGFVEPFGGWGPGPRYLMPMLPFLAAPLALAFRRLPVTTVALALVSIVWMVAATATVPLLPNNYLSSVRRGDIANTGRWFDRVADGDFTRTIVTSAGGGHGWIGIIPFLLAVVAALALAGLATQRPPIRRHEAEVAAVVLAGWLLAALTGPVLLRHDRATGSSLGALAVTALVASIVTTAVRVNRSGALAAVPALPLVAFGVHRFGYHQGWALGLALAVLALSLALERRALRGWIGGRAGRVSYRRDLPARGRP